MKKTKPAVYSGPMGWGWTNLGELAQIIGLTSAETFNRFFALTKDADKGVLAVAFAEDYPDGATSKSFSRHVNNGMLEEVYGWSKEDQLRDRSGQINSGDVFVPTGWSGEVLRLWKAGCRYIEEGYGDNSTPLSVYHEAITSCCDGGCGFLLTFALDEEGKQISGLGQK